MNIGIDLDGVLTNYRQFALEQGQKYCRENNKGKLVNPEAYYMKDMYNWDEETDYDFWIKNIFLYARENPVIEGAAENIKKLKADGNNIFIITARKLATPDDNCREEIREKMKTTVKEWLAKNEIEYDYIIFSKEDKSKNIIEKNIDVMIEDSPNNAKNLSKLTKIICFDWPYNKGIENENIYRCYNWDEIYDTVVKLFKI